MHTWNSVQLADTHPVVHHKVLTAAYDTLRDPVRRRQYDLGLLTERQDHYLGPGDVFEQLLLQVK